MQSHDALTQILKVVIQVEKPYFTHKNIPPLVSFTSNKPIVTCIRVQNSFRKIITMAKMSTLPLNIQRLKLVEIVATYVRFGSTCKLYLFLPL
jgi:hypothetical protein